MKRPLFFSLDSFLPFLYGGLASWIAFSCAVLLYGKSPAQMFYLLYEGTWGSAYGIGQIVFKATPILFTGAAIQFAFRAGLFNLGAEGQLMAGSLAAACVGVWLGALPAPFSISFILFVSALAGVFAAFPMAILKVRFGVHEVLSSILLNRIIETGSTVLLAGGLALPGTVRTASLPPSALLSRFEKLHPVFKGSAANFSFVLAVLFAFISSSFFRRYRAGIEMTQISRGEKACVAEHIPVKKRQFEALLFSGALAGLASSATVLGYKGYYEQGLGAGAGYTGIAVAMLARTSPWALIFAALLFGTLGQGGLAINAYVPREIMDVLTALILIVVSITQNMGRFRFTKIEEA